jgi:Protein of unknown function (DUF2752)
MPALLQTRRRHAYIALAAASFFAVVLYRFPPGEYGFYPRCPVYALTGWQCPGCGMTRALDALLHGHVVEALRWNPLVLPVVAGFVAWMVTIWRGWSAKWPRVPNFVVAVLLVITGVFTVIRNLP